MIKIIVLQSDFVIMENSDIFLDIWHLAHVYYDWYVMHICCLS